MTDASGMGRRDGSWVGGESFAEGRSTVRVTALGLKLLMEKRPDCHERLLCGITNGSTGAADAPNEPPAVPVETSC